MCGWVTLTAMAASWVMSESSSPMGTQSESRALVFYMADRHCQTCHLATTHDTHQGGFPSADHSEMHLATSTAHIQTMTPEVDSAVALHRLDMPVRCTFA